MKQAILTMAALFLCAAARADTIEMKVYGMVCGFCAQGIEASLRKNPATEEVYVSLENKLVAVRTRSGVDIPDTELKKAINEAGYDLKGVTRTHRTMQEIRGTIPLASQ